MIRSPHVRHVHRLIRCGVIVLCGGAAWLATRMVFGGEARPAIPQSVRATETADLLTSTQQVNAEGLSSLWSRDLRQELIPPKPPEPETPPPAPPPPPVRLPQLLATFVEAGSSWALFVDAAGRQRIQKTGGKIDEFDISAVSPGACTLQAGERTFEVRVPIEAKLPGPQRSSRRGG